MQSLKTGNVQIYAPDGAQQEPDADDRQLLELAEAYEEKDYHCQITVRKNWTVMYQLAESRVNLIEWLELEPGAEVLELGAGCGTITSALIKKGLRVTCQEERLAYCKVNALRHSQDPITIYALPLDQCLKMQERKYDVIFALELPASEEGTRQLIGTLSGLLKPHGFLVLAVKNKFGLKYWAGNTQMDTHKYFAGLENAGVRMHSKSSLSKLLRENGLDFQEFYYPYPDERFARDIYSDRYLPKKGDLNYNIVNYEGDRLLLFDEQKVFDSILEEGQFPFFANAYLCLASAKERTAQEASYTRYASDRSREHAVRTQIVEESVRKQAIYVQGAAHIAHILQAYERLREQYADTDLTFNKCAAGCDAQGNKYAQFERLHGQALQEQIGQAAALGQMQKIFDILRRMMQYIRSGGAGVPFTRTDDFTAVFGQDADEAVLRQTICSPVCDIDLILENIIVDADGKWNVIDYEWTFFFPVPQNFIIYRTLFFLNHENPDREELSMERLLEFAEIPAQEAAVYARMEEAFQRYVTGGLVPYREMVNRMERRFFNVVQLKADYDRIAAQNELLKGKGIWKAVRKIKKKLTGDKE